MGSEMCIRDSRHPDAGMPLPERLHHRILSALGDQHIVVQLLAGCLLYTSDAADDLLCVDLGGRRIIKKKNITKH